MKLITEKGALAIPEDVSLEITKTNPFFSDEGEQSLPVSLPSSPRNRELLGHPERISNFNQMTGTVPVLLSSGIFQKTGKLVVGEVSGGAIDVSVAFAESDFYLNYSDMPLTELLEKTYHSVPGETLDTVEKWASYLNSLMHGTISDPVITMACVQVDNSEGVKDSSPYFFLNECDSYYKNLIWEERDILVGYKEKESGEIEWIYERVPDGYGVTPFIYLHALLKVIFERMGYNVEYNAFDTDTNNLNKIVLLNNNADTICKGKVCYADIVPACTVSEFIQFLKDKFCALVIMDYGNNSVRIELMENILSSSPLTDISGNVDGAMTLRKDTFKHVVLSSKTDVIARAAPAADDVWKFYHSNKEIYFQYENPTISKLGKKTVMSLYTGTYWKVNLFATRLGTNMFPYRRYRTYDDTEEPAEESATEELHEANDIIPVMHHTFILATYIYPYIGERRHTNTYVEGTKANSDGQDIIVAFVTRQNSTGFMTATTQRYLDKTAWNTWSLTPEDIYTKFWKKYDTVLLNNRVDVEMKVNFTPAQLQSLSIEKPMMYKNMPMIPKYISYIIGGTVTNGVSLFWVTAPGEKVPKPYPPFQTHDPE